jgi:hypothetical protein
MTSNSVDLGHNSSDRSVIFRSSGVARQARIGVVTFRRGWKVGGVAGFGGLRRVRGSVKSLLHFL